MVGEADPRLRELNQFSYRGSGWVSTEFVKISSTGLNKSDFYQQTLRIFPPQW